MRVIDLGVWVSDFESLRMSDFESDKWVWKFESDFERDKWVWKLESSRVSLKVWDDERGGVLIGQKSSFCNLSL